MGLVVDLEVFRRRLRLFSSDYARYARDFDRFWVWKLGVECDSGVHILSRAYLGEAYCRLFRALRRWQVYRGVGGSDRWVVLRESLWRIGEAYDRIRGYSLLDFDRIPIEPLRLIWDELGRVKEGSARVNSRGEYYVISVCKPLMLLWGQTLAFDSRVRANIPLIHCRRRARWSFEDWIRAMRDIQHELETQEEVIDAIRKESLKRYGCDSVVPYGRFLDIYYFMER